MKLSRRIFLKGIALAPLYFLLSSFLSKFRAWPANSANAESAPGGSNVILKVMSESAFLTAGDGKMYFTIPAELHGLSLVSAGAHVYTPSTIGDVKIQLHNATRGVDFFSTALTIEEKKKDSAHSAVAAVISTNRSNVLEGDELCIDVDSPGTGAKGLEVRLRFGKA